MARSYSFSQLGSPINTDSHQIPLKNVNRWRARHNSGKLEISGILTATGIHTRLPEDPAATLRSEFVDLDCLRLVQTSRHAYRVVRSHIGCEAETERGNEKELGQGRRVDHTRHGATGVSVAVSKMCGREVYDGSHKGRRMIRGMNKPAGTSLRVVDIVLVVDDLCSIFGRVLQSYLM